MAEGNRLYPFPGLGNTFPQDKNTVPNPRMSLLRPLGLAREIKLQIARINHWKVDILSCLRSLKEINNSILEKDFATADRQVIVHKKNYGISLVLTKKELLLAFMRNGFVGLNNSYKILTDDTSARKWDLLCHYIYGLLDPTFPPTVSNRIWLRAIQGQSGPIQQICKVIENEIKMGGASELDLSSTILWYSTLSLLDVLIDLWQKYNLYEWNPSIAMAFRELDVDIANLLISDFLEITHSLPILSPLIEGKVSDAEIYRSACLFDEIASVSVWRYQFASRLFARKPSYLTLKKNNEVLGIKKSVDAIVNRPSTFTEIAEGLRNWELVPVGHSPLGVNSVLLSLTLVVEAITTWSENFESDKEIPVAELLVMLDDFIHYLDPIILQRFADRLAVSGCLTLEFLLKELTYRKFRDQDNELERRLAFMNLFKGCVGEQFTDLLGEIKNRMPSTAFFIARVCTRLFLERLFLLMESLRDVLSTRLAVCKWLLSNFPESSESVKEEIDALDREINDLEARSDLDSTRVHVDEEGLREWFGQTQGVSVKRYIQTVLAEGVVADPGSLLRFYTSKEVREGDEGRLVSETEIGSEFLLVEIFDATLKAFAADRTFGLDGYLSRRIRHGTLNGQIMTPVSRVLRRWTETAEESKCNGQMIDADLINELVGRIRKFLSAELDIVRKDILQLKLESRPSGLISATWKTPTNVAHLDALIGRVRGKVIAAQGAYDPFSDIYSLCWDCIEPDLAQLRYYVIRTLPQKIDAGLTEIIASLPPRERHFSRSSLEDLSRTLGARLQTVCGWFIRPVFRRDQYILAMLITSMLSVVRELDDGYRFSERVRMSEEVYLNRGGFDLFSDVLFILIGNAAKHGKRDSNISISVDLYHEKLELALLEVRSEVESEITLGLALQRIRDAIAIQDEDLIYQAGVTEGFSGLRKLILMVKHIRNARVFLRVVSNKEDLSISFQLLLPTKLMFIGTRG